MASKMQLQLRFGPWPLLCNPGREGPNSKVLKKTAKENKLLLARHEQQSRIYQVSQSDEKQRW